MMHAYVVPVLNYVPYPEGIGRSEGTGTLNLELSTGLEYVLRLVA